jgi:Fanconi anemia group M protein
MNKTRFALNKFKPRTYQETIFARAVFANTLVVLPTGLGKTAIAIMLAIQRLNTYPNSKIVLFAPTKPLVDQHLQTFKDLTNIPGEDMVLFTGSTSPAKRIKLWENAKIIFSTPQGFENDILSSKLSFKDVSLVIFDEAHRAVKEYSYVYLALEYHKQAQNERILALTASPGTDLETVSNVLENLSIEEIEVRKTTDPDVAPYMQEISIEQLKVELPKEILKLRRYLLDCFLSKLKKVKKFGFMNRNIGSYNKTDLLKLQSALFIKAQKEKSIEIMMAISVLAEANKINYAIELAETQSVFAVNEYLKRLEEESLTAKTKAIKNLVRDPNFRVAKILSDKLIKEGIEHPKLNKLTSLSKLYTNANPESKVIIFTQFRDTALKVKEFLDKDKINSELFFGQAKKNGYGHSQKQQKQIIQDFKDHKFSILIATSVAEEGLDIPSVDLVIFYETIPSAIRTVQRRGRTGRHTKGRIITLITKGTRDEAFKWVSHHKEKRMYRVLDNVKKNFALRIRPEKKLESFVDKSDGENLRIFCDYREKGNKVLKYLKSKGVNISLDNLSAGDFLLSDKTIVEFKLVEDFVSSLLDKRLFEQAGKLKRLYENKIMIIQGIDSIYEIRRIHPNAIRGALASLMLNYGLSIIQTKNPEETAGIIISLAKREQIGNSRKMIMHSSKPLTIKKQQEYIVSSFSGIGNTLNKPLLNYFKSIKQIINADEKDLMNVDLIGKVKAKRLFDLFNTKY